MKHKVIVLIVSGILLTINDRSLSLNQQLVNDLRQFQHFNF
jgi:hypothetical protein